ncbi:MAG: heavy metal sensor histidine kinase [Candidatus Scalindua sp.]
MSSKSWDSFFKTVGFKITIWYSLSVFTILIIFGGFLYFRLSYKLRKEIRSILFDESEDILQSIQNGNHSVNDLQNLVNIKSSSMRYMRRTVRLYDIEQNTFITPGNFFDPKLKISENTISNTEKGKHTFEKIWIEGSSSPYLLITRPVKSGNSLKYILQVGIYMKLPYKSLETVGENFLILIPVLFIVSIAGGWLIARKSLAPIENITETTRKITSSNLSTRLSPIYTGDELAELIKTINLMLDRLEASFKRTVQFTTDASHELRTPIASLKTGIEVILSRERTSEEYRELLEGNLNDLERMTRMISDLLELSRSDSGANILHLKSFNLSKMLKDLQNTFRPVSDSKKIRLSINGMPSVRIKGDEILLRRVFANLLDNAIKYTSHGDSICFALEDRGNDVVVRIEDTGIGISAEDFERIFDRFFRVDSSRSRVTGGTGLGLNICKSIVGLHQGKIEVKSELGVGSTFEVIIPKNLLNS